MSSREARERVGELEKEADKLVKKGKSCLGPSLLDMRLKADWETAGPLFEKAANLYKQAGNLPKAIDAYERAAQAEEKMDSKWHAAKHMELCAELCRKTENWEGVVNYFRNAVQLYVESGKGLTGAEVLTKAAAAVKEVRAEDALTMLYEALDLYDSEEREGNAADVFRQTVALLIKMEKWSEAVEVQMRFGAACDKVAARGSQVKAYLGAVVTYLYAKDARSAWQTFQDALAIDAFMSSDEAFAADALFQAYRDADADAVRKIVSSKSCFKALDNQVARLALKLPTGNVEDMADQLSGTLGDDGEGEGSGDGHDPLL